MKNLTKIWNSRKPECLLFMLFLCAYCIVSAFHEPWFDEAQVWQIAKCASLHDLLFEIPHYEGHPAFWSLLLAVPAKLGVPFEVGLKLTGLLISTASVYVILFRSHYPHIVRMILPFTYFVFYQYGVIVRPYTLMVLLFLLLSLAFPDRHKRPWHFVGLLMLLCLTGAYAIVLSGGIALCYVWEIIQEKGIKRLFVQFFTDRRILALLALLLLAILLALEIMPRDNTLMLTKSNANNSFLLCLAATLFTFVGESTLTTGSWFALDTTLLQQVNINIAELIMFSLIGIILWTIILGASSGKALKYFVIPYLMLALFAAAVYFGVHHIGVVYALLLFWVGILFQDPNRFEIGKKWISVIAKSERDRRLLSYPVIILSTACLLVPVYWCAAACIQDIQHEYSCGRTVAQWIKTHNLENCTFLNVWGLGTFNEDADREEILLYDNTYTVGMPVEISAYFNRNICLNLNFGRDDEAYMHYRVATPEENDYALRKWAESGAPDILLQKPRLKDIFGDSVKYDEYRIVLLLPEHRIWKNHSNISYTPIFARNDILEKYRLDPIQDKGLDYYINGFQITDEMKKQYESGVSVEEILKPYLDAIFAEED